MRTTDGPPIPVGVLFSLTGTTAIIERSLYRATMLAIETINARGGVNGRPLVPVYEDYASDPLQAVAKAQKLIRQDRCVATVGCYSSASRKAVLPIFEQEHSILLYPAAYESQECSGNIVYTGAVPNQQLADFVPWIIQHIGRDFFLIGSDHIYPHRINHIVKGLVEVHGGRVLAEYYVPPGWRDFEALIERIRAAGPSTVFSTLVGDSIPIFYQQYWQSGITARDIPITSPVTTEEEIRVMGANVAVGHYTSANYFQSVDTPQNRTFVREFKARYGKDSVTNFFMEAAYFQTFLLAQAMAAVDPENTEDLIEALVGQEFLAPQGPVKIDQNHHTFLTARIGRVNAGGQFDIVWQSKSSIKPEVWFEVPQVKRRPG